MTGAEWFGWYRLDSLLGMGGMGEVYRAFDSRKDRLVALKRLPAMLGADEEFRSRFEREARIVARLSEPHIIPVHDYGVIDDRPFIDMRLVDGLDLSALIRRDGTLSIARAVDIVTQVASALDAAHDDGLVHRDVKPSNILLTENPAGQDFAYLIDFGIARGGRHSGVTSAGAAVGTTAYMAPERFNPTQDPGPTTDVYALGCVLHELLTGTPPFPGDDLQAMYGHVYTAPPRPSHHRVGVPSALDEVILRALNKEPPDRYGRAGDLATAALAARSQLPPDQASRPGNSSPPLSPAPVPPGQRLADVATRIPGGVPAGPEQTVDPTRSRRSKRLVAVTSTILTVAGVAALLAWFGVDQATTDPIDDGSVAPSAVIATVPVGPNPQGLSLTPDGSRAYVTDGAASSVTVIDTNTNTTLTTIPVTYAPTDVAITPDGTHAYVTSARTVRSPGAVTVIDTATDTVTATIPINANDVAITPDGRRAYVTAGAGGDPVSVIDTASNTIIGSVPDGGEGDITVAPDGRRAYITKFDSSSIAVIDTATDLVSSTIEVGARPDGVAVTQDGAHAYVANFGNNTVSAVDLVTGRTTATIPAGNGPRSVEVTPDGRRAYVTNYNQDTVTVIDTATNTALVPMPGGGPTEGLALALDGRYAYVSNHRSNSVSVIDTQQDG